VFVRNTCTNKNMYSIKNVVVNLDAVKAIRAANVTDRTQDDWCNLTKIEVTDSTKGVLHFLISKSHTNINFSSRMPNHIHFGKHDDHVVFMIRLIENMMHNQEKIISENSDSIFRVSRPLLLKRVLCEFIYTSIKRNGGSFDNLKWEYIGYIPLLLTV
ncbi:hypothetical protein ACJX0J_038332, partial [Zea mays]